MTVFKTFLKVLNKCKVPVLLYSVMLIFFSALNMQTSETNMSFVASKPDVLIINEDEEEGITKNLMEYIKQNSNIKEIEQTEDAIKDALFYREVNYIIYIPHNYRKEFLEGKNPEIKIKSTGDYQSSLAEMMLERYIKVANTYKKNFASEEILLNNINDTLSKQSKVEITSKLDTENIEKATLYYNFANYSILAGCVYVICLILSSFKEQKVAKRTLISSTNYKKHNRLLLLSNTLFACCLWIFYVILSFILIGKVMFTLHGLIYIVNSFVFTICAVTIAFLIGNLVNNKNSINGIVNVIALGSCFLCGAFVPMKMLPNTVLKIAHVLPSYYYISSNELIKGLEIINFDTLKPIFANMAIIIVFSILFILITNIISKRKRRIG